MKRNIEDGIEVGGLLFRRAAGKPGSFVGRHSGRKLARIDMDFSVGDPNTALKVKGLFEKGDVDVKDPFSGRAYRARFRMRSES